MSRLLADKGRTTEVRGKALACLIRCGAKDTALPTCIEVVRTRHTPLLEVAVAGLGQIGDRAATPILKQLLDEMAEKEQLTCEYLVVVNAMEALARLEGDAAAGTIRPFAKGRWAQTVARDAQRLLDALAERRDG